MTDHTSSDIVALIRAKNFNGSFSMSNSEACLLVDLFASVAATRAERDMLVEAANSLSDRTQRVIIVGDHDPEPRVGASA
jgi:hypothetical protein